MNIEKHSPVYLSASQPNLAILYVFCHRINNFCMAVKLIGQNSQQLSHTIIFNTLKDIFLRMIMIIDSLEHI